MFVTPSAVVIGYLLSITFQALPAMRDRLFPLADSANRRQQQPACSIESEIKQRHVYSVK